MEQLIEFCIFLLGVSILSSVAIAIGFTLTQVMLVWATLFGFWLMREVFV
jgi:hypothetical protein